jgi:hypothetical protein
MRIEYSIILAALILGAAIVITFRYEVVTGTVGTFRLDRLTGEVVPAP